LERQLAIFFLRIGEAFDRTRHTNRFVANQTHVLNNIALLVEIHILGGAGRGLLSIVNEMGRSITNPNEQESPATKVSRLRMNDGQRKPGRNRRVDRVSAS